MQAPNKGKEQVADKTIEVFARVPFNRFGVPHFAVINPEPGEDRNISTIPLSKLDDRALATLVEAWIEDVYAKAEKKCPFSLPIIELG